MLIEKKYSYKVTETLISSLFSFHCTNIKHAYAHHFQASYDFPCQNVFVMTKQLMPCISTNLKILVSIDFFKCFCFVTFSIDRLFPCE